MKRFLTALLAFLVLFGLSAPAWAQNQKVESKTKQCTVKKDTRDKHHYPKVDKHKIKALIQFKELKKTYARSIEDARQMFLEYLGSSMPTGDCDVQAIRAEYEQQIAQLKSVNTTQQQQIAEANQTIASQQEKINLADSTIATQTLQLNQANEKILAQQQQITGLEGMVTSYGNQVANLTTTVGNLQDEIKLAGDTIALLGKQLDDLKVSYQAELDSQAAELQQCKDQADTQYDDGYAAGMATCANSGPPAQPQLDTSWSTGLFYPYALDVDGAGNTYIVEKGYGTVVAYDQTGSKIWDKTPDALISPVDLAVDSLGDIFILDQSAEKAIQKFTHDGEIADFDTGSVTIVYPHGLFIDSQDNVYVTDMGGAYGSRILKFGPTGTLIDTIGEVNDPDLAGQEYNDVAVDETTHAVYIVTRYNHVVAKFKTDGTYQVWQGNLGNNPNSIAVGAQGQVFVADTGNNQIDEYDADGTLLYTIEGSEIYAPTRIVVDGTGKLYIAEDEYQMIRVYR